MNFKFMLPNPSAVVKSVKDWATTIVPATKFLLSGNYASVSFDDKISWGKDQRDKLSAALWIFAIGSLVVQALTIFNTLAVLTWTGLLFSAILTMVFSVAVWVVVSQLPQFYKNPYMPFFVYIIFAGWGAIAGVTAIFSSLGALARLTQGSGWISLLGAVINFVAATLLMDLILGVIRGENQFADVVNRQFGGTTFQTPNPFKYAGGVVRGPQAPGMQPVASNPFEMQQPQNTNPATNQQPAMPNPFEAQQPPVIQNPTGIPNPFEAQQVQGSQNAQPFVNAQNQPSAPETTTGSNQAADPTQQWMDML